MKALLHVALAAAAAIGSAALISAEGPVAPSQSAVPKRVASHTEGDSITSTYLDTIESLVQQGASPAIALGHLQTHLKTAPMTKALRKELTLAVGYMQTQVETSYITAEDVELLRIEVVHARAAAAVLEFRAEAALHGWKPEVLYRAVMEWVLSTDIFEDSPASIQHRLYLAAGFERAMLLSNGTAAMGSGLTTELLRERLSLALRRLTNSRDRGEISTADYERFRESAIARARAIILENF